MKHSFLIAILLLGGLAVTAQAQSLETAQYFEHGVRSLENAQPQRALEYFNNSLTSAERGHTSPQFRAKINYNIGVSLYRLNRFEEAADYYRKAISLSDGHYTKASNALKIVKEKIHRDAPSKTEARAHSRSQ